jgi:hypothetical protein
VPPTGPEQVIGLLPVCQVLVHGAVIDSPAVNRIEPCCGCHSLGFVPHGEATGRLTFAPPAGWYRYRVVETTGAFRHWHTQGVMRLPCTPAPTPGWYQGGRGTFTTAL